jgi:hypothetical protein
MSSMMGQNATKDRMRTKLEQRQQAANFTLEAKAPNELVFKMPEEGVQEKSQAPVKPAQAKQPIQAEVTDDWLEDMQSGVAKNPTNSGGKKKKGKGKK